MEVECAEDSSAYLVKLTINKTPIVLGCQTKGQKVEIPSQNILLICEDPAHYCKAQNPCHGKCGSRYSIFQFYKSKESHLNIKLYHIY